jgi:uncharacterized protein (DUF302 family)
MTTTVDDAIHLALPFTEAVERTRAVLQAEGFGVLTSIDMQAAFREKLGADFRPYVILGACNPPLAYKALTASPEAGLMLPCNVTVEEVAPGRSVVRFARPELALQANPAGHPAAVREVAAEADTRLRRAADSLRLSGPAR